MRFVSGQIGRALLAAGIMGVLPWLGAMAQTTTGSIRGYIRDAQGNPLSAVQVVARNAAMGQERGATTADNGFYTVPGLRPGAYELTVRRIGLEPQTRTVRVLIGDVATADFVLTTAAVQLSEIVAVARVETAAAAGSEVATNITREQMEALPQSDRNFLNFAGLAPGVTVSREETRKEIRAAGLPASKINVFVDGASYKNDLLEGGVHGQDASRGNPFPQLAVSEFRIITQNFKAEYQRAASAVVTATTRSGTNEFELDGFLLGQNKGLVTEDPGSRLRCDLENVCLPKPEYERLQLGISAGGPITRDELFYFVGYEGNYQNRAAQVSVGRPEYRSQFAQYEGTFDQPFRSHLPFGKLTWHPNAEQTLDISYNGRIEYDKRGFGGTTSFESAENVEIGYHVVTVQHGWTRGNLFNQAHISAQRSTWNPTVVNESQDIGLNYEGVIRIGARDTEQRFVQDRIALRDDITWTGLQWAGSHVFKAGANIDFLNYEVAKRFNGNPLFVFNPAESMTAPIRAHYGVGDPGMDERNVQFGLFLQDDWNLSDRLQLNLGLRWDAETNQFNNEWVTPDSIRNAFDNVAPAAGQNFVSFDPNDYFTSGRDDRPIFLGAIQPRLGFTFDVLGTGRTVVHGGFGIYYDREIWNRLIDERFRLQWAVLTFPFTTTNEPNEIPWDPSYLSRQGLEGLLAQANRPGLIEVFLSHNDTRPPRTHQWNFGVRQTVLDNLVLGAVYRGVNGYNIMSWYCATPHSVHGFCEGLSEQGNTQYRGLILNTDEGRTWYNAFDITAEKPMTADSRWGVTFAYTFADGQRKGSDFFTLDYPGVDPRNWPKEDMNLEKHHVTASGVVALPAQVQLSTIVQWGSGVRFNRIDEIAGWGPARADIDFASEDPPNFRQIDLRLQKNFAVRGDARVGLLLEAINVTDEENFRGYEQLYRFGDGNLNQNFGRSQWWTADPGRRLQIGLTIGN